jgi:hypothetical protein
VFAMMFVVGVMVVFVGVWRVVLRLYEVLLRRVLLVLNLSSSLVLLFSFYN